MPTNPASRCECHLQYAAPQHKGTVWSFDRCPACLERDRIGEEAVRLLALYAKEYSKLGVNPLLERAARAGMGTKK